MGITDVYDRILCSSDQKTEKEKIAIVHRTTHVFKKWITQVNPWLSKLSLTALNTLGSYSDSDLKYIKQISVWSA